MDHLHRDGIGAAFLQLREDVARFQGYVADTEPVYEYRAVAWDADDGRPDAWRSGDLLEAAMRQAAWARSCEPPYENVEVQRRVAPVDPGGWECIDG
jgi:hypothetical protein